MRHAILSWSLLLVLIGGTAGAADIKGKLQRTVLPEVDFREARIEDVFDFLIDTSRELDSEADTRKRGVNFVLNLTPEQKGRTVTFAGRNMSLLDVVNAVAGSAGVPYRITKHVVIIGGGRMAPVLEVRAYPIPLSLLRAVKEEGARKYLASLGVAFPEGASAKYSATTGRLVVVNTAENLEIVEKLIRDLTN